MSTVGAYMGQEPMRLDKESKDIVFNAGIGIEVELEEVQPMDIPLWTCVEDGSLRNGREFICSRPYSGIQLKKAINNFSAAMEQIQPNGSWRCSTHVHMDMRDATVQQLKKTILAYVFYEHILYGCSGMQRYKSNFAPAMNAVQEQLVMLAEAWDMDDGSFLHQIVHTWDKYSCFNLKPLARQGSVELRISEPKWQKENLMLLVNRMLTLKMLAFASPEEETYDSFLGKLWDLGIQPMRDYLVGDYVFQDEHLTEGYINACDILSMRSAGSVVYTAIPQSNTTELSDENIITVPSSGHWRNIYRYIVAHWSDDRERNTSMQRSTNIDDYHRFMDIFRESVERDGEITLGEFNSLTEFFIRFGDSAVAGAMREVLEAYQQTNEEF